MSLHSAGEAGEQLERACSPISVPPTLLWFWVLICALSLISLLFTFSMTYIFQRGYPYGLPLIRTDVTEWDFRVFADRFTFFRTSHFWEPFQYPFTYPAPLGVVFGVLYRLPHPLRIYLGTLLAAVCGGAWWLTRQLMFRGISRCTSICFVGTLCLTSWPLLVLAQRGNIEGIVIIVLALGLAAVLRGRGWTGATLIGIAASMKIFPLILAGLLLSRRQYKELVWCLIVITACSLGSLRILGPGTSQAQRNINAGLTFFKQTFACNPLLSDLGEEHSLFTLIKLPVILLGDHSYEHSRTEAAYAAKERMRTRISLALNIYLPLAAFTGISAYYLRIRKLPILNQTAILCVCAILLPPVSWDYTLPHLLFPCSLLCLYAVDTWRLRQSTPGLGLCFACLALVFTYGGAFTYKFRLAGQLRALALCMLLVPLLRYPYKWSPAQSGWLGTSE